MDFGLLLIVIIDFGHHNLLREERNFTTDESFLMDCRILARLVEMILRYYCNLNR